MILFVEFFLKGIKLLLSSKRLPWLFSTTAFVGASLIFIVQPLISKILLPHFGGAATLWATASLFFQTVLLLGYLLVHFTSRLNVRRQYFIILPIALLSLLSLPIAFHGDSSSTLNPVLRVIVSLSVMVGLPFFIVSTTGPITQRWYSLSDGPRNDDPYFIYAASNVGSFVGLLSYPFVIEPFLSLKSQGVLWGVVFVVYLLFLSFCFLQVKSSNKVKPAKRLLSDSIPTTRKLKWVFLAFVPSSLMLGMTTYIATDVGSFPLLWIIPLAIYLLTMIIAFARTKRSISKKILITSSVLSIATAYLVSTHFSSKNASLLVAGTLFCLFSLFVISLVFHATLAADRPSAESLTGFFVLVSVGGALGGLFNGFLAPVIFRSAIELLLVLLLSLLLMVGNKKKEIISIMLMLCVTFAIVYVNDGKDAILKERTFYGSYTILGNDEVTYFNSGTTIHGIQYSDDLEKPTSYYAEGGPLGSLFKTHGNFKNVVGVGLGVGTIAAYGEPGDKYTFLEIDPKVKEIASNPKYFTYLRDSKAEVEIKIGDGRLLLEDVPDKSLDLLVLDAFSSDSIPTHLLTSEAFKLYKEKLSDDGVLAVHVSNRFYDLVPVVENAGQELDTNVLVGEHEDEESFPATWLVLTKDQKLVKDLMRNDWLPANTKPVRWTDDYAPLLKVFKGVR